MCISKSNLCLILFGRDALGSAAVKYVLCFQALQGRLAFCLQDFLLDLEAAKSILGVNSTKAYQTSKNKLLRTRILLPALFFVLITQQYGWTFEKKKYQHSTGSVASKGRNISPCA